MPDPSNRFIGLATRSLEGDAKEIAATELAARLAHAGADERVVEEAAARLEKVRVTSGSRGLWVLGLVVAGLAVVLGILIPRHWREARLLEPIHWQGRDGKFHERVLAEMGPAAADVPLRTFYHLDFDAWSVAVEALLKEDPDDPARYWFHAQSFSHLSRRSVLSPDFEKRWKELDPDNALWPLATANILAEGSVWSGRKATVANEPHFEQALVFFRQAAGCDHVRSLADGVRERQLRSFKSDGSLKGVQMRFGLLNLASAQDGVILYSLGGVLLAQAERHDSARNIEGMRALISDLRKVLILMWSDPEGDLSSTFYFTRYCFSRLAAICRGMGLNDDAARLERVVNMESELRKGAPVAKLEDFSRHSGTSEKWKPEYHQQAPSADDRKPGRLAEYAVADRFTALAGVLAAFVVAAGGLIEILRSGAHSRRLAGGLMPLFRASDRAWLFGLGLLFPAVWWFGITWYSPLGCRDIGLTFFEIKGFPMMQPWLSQGLGGLVLAFVLLVQTARWRLGKRASFLALRPPRMWIGWTMAVLAALFIPAQGIVRYLSADQDKFLLYGSAAGGIALLWLLWQAAMGLFAARENALGGQVLLRLLMPGVIALALLLLGAMPVLRKSERRWVAEIEGYPRSPFGFLINPVQVNEADRIRKALLEALE